MSRPTNPRFLSEQQTLTLIKEVKSRPFMWNRDALEYSNRHQTAQAWEEIATLMDIKEDVLRSKWKILRDLFKREIRKSKASSLESYTGMWRHFEALWFLAKPEYFVFDEDTEAKDESSTQEQEIVTTQNQNGFFMKEEPANDDFEACYEEDPFLPERAVKRRKTSEDNNYDMMFLESLMPYFGQLEPMRKLVVRSKIQDMLLNELAAQNGTNKGHCKS